MTSQPKFTSVPSIMSSSANCPCIMPRLKSKSETTHSEIHHENDGQDLRIASDTWCKLAASEARLHLMVQLGHLEVGFPDVENFCLELETKYRAKVDGELREKGTTSPEWKIVNVCMALKMILDERRLNSKLETEKYEAREKIEKVLGKNSRKARNIVKKLRQDAARHKVILMKKHEEKLKHLRRKYRKNEEEKVGKIPEALENLGLENISVFNSEKYEKKKAKKYEPEIIGEIDLHDNERLILMLPPKFSIEENLPRDGLLIDEEMAYAKTRMTINKEMEERIEEEDEGLGLGE